MIITPEELTQLIDVVRSKKNEKMHKVYYFIGKGRKIQAIKEYRSLTEAGLKTAKEAVEEIMSKLGEISHF